MRRCLVCAAAGALGLACAAGVEPELPQVATAACVVPFAGEPWWNQSLADQAGRFHVELDATSSNATLDAVIGLSDGPVTGFAQLGPIVRFNPAGALDARDGAAYRADVTQRYEVGKTYHLRLDVDVRTHTYSVWLRGDVGGYTALARNYRFRTEQAGVTRLNNIASKIDGAGGTLAICGVQVVADATTADGCVIADAGLDFVSVPLHDATVLDTVTFTVTASVPNIDAVAGLSAGPARGFSDLAAAVRLAPSGMIDARDGGGYRAEVARPYGTSPLDVRMTADLTTHTYSVFQGTTQNVQEVARRYAFRTEQQGAAHLDQLSAVVDGPQGSVSVCFAHNVPSINAAYSREGSYAVLPLAGDQALISDGARTVRVDAAGHDTAQLARGGQLAVDVLGDVFVAGIAGNTLTVDQYDPSFAPRWEATDTVLAGTAIAAMTSDPTGAVLVAMVTPQNTRVTVSRFTAGGALASQLSVSGNAVTLDGDQPIVAWNDGGTLRITRFDPSGATRWTKAFAGQAAITAMAADPGHQVVFGGELFTATDFGGGTLPVIRTENGPLNGFVVELSAAGDHVFSTRTGTTEVGGIAANGARIAVSSTERTQFHYEHLQEFDPAGHPITLHFNTSLGENGFGDRVAMGASGRVWWSLRTQWPLFPAWPYLVVLAP